MLYSDISRLAAENLSDPRVLNWGLHGGVGFNWERVYLTLRHPPADTEVHNNSRLAVFAKKLEAEGPRELTDKERYKRIVFITYVMKFLLNNGGALGPLEPEDLSLLVRSYDKLEEIKAILAADIVNREGEAAQLHRDIDAMGRADGMVRVPVARLGRGGDWIVEYNFGGAVAVKKEGEVKEPPLDVNRNGVLDIWEE